MNCFRCRESLGQRDTDWSGGPAYTDEDTGEPLCYDCDHMECSLCLVPLVSRDFNDYGDPCIFHDRPVCKNCFEHIERAYAAG